MPLHTVTDKLIIAGSIFDTFLTYDMQIIFVAIRIGWSEHTCKVVESTNSVTMMLIKEDDVLSEQTFIIKVSVQLWPYSATSILPAIQTSNERENSEGDFAFTNKSTYLNLQFLPSMQVLQVELSIYDDNIAEGPEGVLLHSDTADGSPGYHFPINSFPNTKVIIEDNDSQLCIYFSVNVLTNISIQISLLGFKWTETLCLSGLTYLKFASSTTTLRYRQWLRRN